jgi:superfamily II DNA or RNA helicase
MVASTLILRDYQSELVGKTLESLAKGHRNIINVASTGAGKTICFVELCNRLSTTLTHDECILIISHLSLLTVQTTKKFEMFSPIKTGVLQADVMPSSNDTVVISTMQSSRNEDKMLDYVTISGKRPRYIITDESHRRFSDSYTKIYGMFPDAQCIDFTATPYKNGKLASGFYDDVAFQISMQELIKKKYLVPPMLRQIKLDSKDSAVKASLILKLYQTKEQGKSGIVFAKSKKEAKLFADVLNNHGINSWVVTDEVNEEQREVIFQKFDDGEAKVLVSVDVLTAGFDAPICSFVIMFQTGSPTAYIQRAGRALRPYPNKEYANIYYVGKTPQIESGEIEKLHNNVIKTKKKQDCETVEELLEWLEDNDLKDTPEYHHSKEVRKATKLAEKLNLSTLSRMLNTKEFPDKFTGRLIEGLDNFKCPKKGDSRITAKQKTILEGTVPANKLKELSKYEANAIIYSLTNKYINPEGRDKYMLQDGSKFAGYHIKDTPPLYKRAVAKKRKGPEYEAWRSWKYEKK